MTPQRIIVGRLLDNSHNEIAPHPRNSFSTLMMIRGVREIKAQRLGATVIAKELGIGRASVYRVLEAAPAG
jgi:Fe2+ or Zn2+ uptake regulation protein